MEHNFTHRFISLLIKCILVSSVTLIFGKWGYSQDWDGDNSVGDFMNDDNWFGNVQPAWSSASDLTFHFHNNASQTSMYFNYGAWRPVKSIIFASSFNPGPVPYPFDSNGNGFDVYWKIENYSSHAQQIRMPLSIRGTSFELNPIYGNLILDDYRIIYNSNNLNYQVYGNNGNHLILRNQPQGDNTSKIVIHEYSIVEIANAMGGNCFAGGVNIEKGELWFNANSSINGGIITVGNGNSNTAKVFLNTGTGGLTINNNIIVPAASADSHIGGLNQTGTNTYSGDVVLNSSAFLEAWDGGIVNFSGDISGSGNVTIQRVCGSGTGTVQYSGTAKTYTGTTTIKSDAALRISSNQTLGNISLENGGALIVDNGSTLTITGAWTGGGTLINYGTIILKGPAAFPGNATTVTAMNNLVLNKAGTTLLDKNITITGSYRLLNGILNIGGNDLTLDVTATTGGNTPGASNMIQADGTGKVIRNFSSTGSFTFPIGDQTSGADYSPAIISLSTLSGTTSMGMNVRDAKHPYNISPANYITRYWNVSATGGNYTGSATFNYPGSDITGYEPNIVSAGYASDWATYSPVNTANHQLVVNDVTDLNKEFTGGDQFSTSSGDYFRSKQSGNWNVTGNWESSPDGTNNWTTSTLVPDQNGKTISILAGHTIHINSPVSLDETIVIGTLQLNSGGILTINNGNGDDITIMPGGMLLVTSSDTYGDAVVINASASVSVSTGGAIQIGNGAATGEGYEAFATSPNNNWEDGSKFIWNNGLAFGTSGFTYFPNAGTESIPMFSVGPTEIPQITSAGSLLINGLFDVRTNITFTSSTGDRNFRDGICGNSFLAIIDGGTQQISGNTSVVGGSNLSISLGKNLNFNKDGMTVTVPTDSNVTFINSGGKIAKAKNANFIVNGTADMTTVNMSNTSGSVDIVGTLITAATDGLIGNSNATVTSGVININPGSTIEYYATVNQKISTTSQLGDQKYYNLILSGDNIKIPSNSNPIIIDDAGSLKITGQPTLEIDATSNNIGPNNTLNTTSFTMESGRLKLGTLGFTGSGTMPLMKGTYNLTGGIIEFAGNKLTTQTIRSGDTYHYLNIEISGNNVGTSGGNVNIKDNGSFIVNPGGIFNININSVKGVGSLGTASVQVKSGGTFCSNNTGGFHGRAPSGLGDSTSSIHANISNITLEPGSTINYSRNNKLSGDGSQPITNANGLQYQNLILSGTGNKIAPPNSLVIKGNFSKTTNAVFVHNNGTVEFNNNTDPQTYTSVSPYPVFYDVINNNTSYLNIGTASSGADDAMYIKHSFTLGNTSKLHLDADVDLMSDEYSTAYIPAIPGGAAITYGNGGFVVERNIPLHSKAWQLLSVPTQGSTIQDAWQMPKGAGTPLWGTTITDPRGNWSANGFDAYSYAPSMKYYDPVNDVFIGIDKTTDPIDNHDAYFLFVRGDRTVTYNGTPTSVMLQTRGKIFEPQNPPATATVFPGKWALVGNPYASAIDFGKLTFSGDPLQQGYYVWDPQLTTSNFSAFGLGGYRQIIPNPGGGYTAVPEDEKYEDGEYPVIQSGQAFFVLSGLTSTSNSFIGFPESAKVNGSANVFRTGSKQGKIRANLYLDVNGQKVLMDGTLHIFGNDYTNNVDRFDAKKIMNSSENISLPSSAYPLIVEQRKWPAEGDTLFYDLSNTRKKKYVLGIVVDNMPFKTQDIYFNDAYLKTSTMLKAGKNEFNFTIDNNISSGRKDRFFLTFKNVIQPFSFNNIAAIQKDNSILISWSTSNQQATAAFVVEHSQDGVNFTALHDIKTSLLKADQYHYLDGEPDAGIHYYRIKALMKDGSTVFSNKVKEEILFVAPGITLYPNPAPQWIQIKFYHQPEGTYTLKLLNTEGKLMMAKSIFHKISATHRIPLNNLASGMYYLELTGPDKLKHTKKIIIE